MFGTSRTTVRRTSSTCTSATSATRSIDPSTAIPSRRCAASGTGCARSRERTVTLRPRTLRARLAVIFAIITIAVSTSVAAFVLLRYRADLTRQINENLEARYADVRATLHNVTELPKHGPPERSVIPRAESFAQVLTPAGVVVDST